MHAKPPIGRSDKRRLKRSRWVSAAVCQQERVNRTTGHVAWLVAECFFSRSRNRRYSARPGFRRSAHRALQGVFEEDCFANHRDWLAEAGKSLDWRHRVLTDGEHERDTHHELAFCVFGDFELKV